MIELEKMQRLLEIARCVGHNGISMLATAYKALIWGTGEAIKRERKLYVPLEEARETLKEPKWLGEKYGTSFPEMFDLKELVG